MNWQAYMAEADKRLSVLSVEREPAEWEAVIKRGDVQIAMAAAQANALLAIASLLADIAGSLDLIRRYGTGQV